MGQPIRALEIKSSILKADLRADQKVDQVVETVEIKSSADAENVLNSTLASIEKEMIIMCEVEIQVDVKDFVERDELDGLGPFELHFPMTSARYNGPVVGSRSKVPDIFKLFKTRMK